MSRIVRPLALALAVFWFSAAAIAQRPAPQVPARISGTIEKADETGVSVRAHDGGATY